MNSKFILLVVLFFIFSCGVKSKPLSPPDTAIPSYTKSFTDTDEKPVPPKK